MAMTKCKECGKEVSDKSITCPSCGIMSPGTPPLKEQLKSFNDISLTFVVVMIAGAIAGSFFLMDQDIPASGTVKHTVKRIESRTQTLDKQFSAWDGSHPSLTQRIKGTMNDPDGYEHVETKYWDREEYLIVQTTFRGKNGFGATVLLSVKARVDLSGNVLEILQ